MNNRIGQELEMTYVPDSTSGSQFRRMTLRGSIAVGWQTGWYERLNGKRQSGIYIHMKTFNLKMNKYICKWITSLEWQRPQHEETVMTSQQDRPSESFC